MQDLDEVGLIGHDRLLDATEQRLDVVGELIVGEVERFIGASMIGSRRASVDRVSAIDQRSSVVIHGGHRYRDVLSIAIRAQAVHVHRKHC